MSIIENMEVVKCLFNTGKLKIIDAKWYYNEGYKIICSHGIVGEIIPPSTKYIDSFKEAL